jgi:hypothetical protein
MYWKTASLSFTDTGAAGTSGTRANAAKWAVKNIFELKNAQDVLVEGNVFEYLWVADQSGYPIVVTPRNQDGGAPWTVVQRVVFRDNLVRHTAGGVNILGRDNIHPSQVTNNITFQNNLFADMNGPAWGGGSKAFQLGDGADTITIDHNTMITTTSSIVYLYGGTTTSPMPTTNVRYTNNMSAHNDYGIMGSNCAPGNSTISAYLPGSTIANNVLAGGSAAKYPSGNFFPTTTAWFAEFVDYASGDYRLKTTSSLRTAATDGTAVGANLDIVNAHAQRALSGETGSAPTPPRQPAGVRLIMPSGS